MLDQQKIDMFIMTNQKYFPEEKIVYLKDRLRTMDDDKFSLISRSNEGPQHCVLVSIFLGVLGIDRFMIGDTGMGVFSKLLTCGCCGVLTIIDWFTISKKTRELNFNKVMTLYKFDAVMRLVKKHLRNITVLLGIWTAYYCLDIPCPDSYR